MSARLRRAVPLVLWLLIVAVDPGSASPDCIYEHPGNEISARYQDAAPDGSAMEQRGNEIDSDYASRGRSSSPNRIADLDAAAESFGYTFDCVSSTYKLKSAAPPPPPPPPPPSSTPQRTDPPVSVTAYSPSSPTTARPNGAVAGTSTTRTTGKSSSSSSTSTSRVTSTTVATVAPIALGATTAPPFTAVAAPTSDAPGSDGPPWPLLVSAAAIIGTGVVVFIRSRLAYRGLGRF